MKQQQQEKEWPLVSIITVNYNGVQVTQELLASLARITYPHVEVIVVDNCSAENPQPIAAAYPHVKLLRMPRNLGFAAGNNAGFKVAQGKYFLLLNNDTEVAPNFLEPLVQTLEQNNSIGAASAKLVYYHSPGVIQYAGSTPINPLTGRGKSIGCGQPDDGAFSTSGPTARAHGAAMLVPAAVVRQVGMLPEMYFLYYEEMDFCAMLTRAGYSIWFVAESVVYHKESFSTGKDSPLKTYYLTRNRLLYMRRNVHRFTFCFSLLYFLGIALPKNAVQYLLSRRLDLLQAYLKGVAWHLLPRTNLHSNTSANMMNA